MLDMLEERDAGVETLVLDDVCSASSGAGGKSRREVNWSCCGLKMQAQLRMGSHVIGPARSPRIHQSRAKESLLCFASGTVGNCSHKAL